MDSKVDFLLKEHPIEYVVQVQKKIKTDIERKKDDLRALIGERYNELLKATQSIEDMKCSVDAVIGSLKNLNHILQSDFDDDSLCIKPKFDIQTKLSDILLDLPMKIWNMLHVENVQEATFCYFSGMQAYNVVLNNKNSLMNDRFHQCNRLTLEDMKDNIIIKAWSLIEDKFKCSNVCQNDICDILLSIMILKQCDLPSLAKELYSRQIIVLSNIIKQANSQEFEQILNITHNTILCSKLFETTNSDISISKSFNELLSKKNFETLNNEIDELKEYFDFSYKKHFQHSKFNFDFESTDSISHWFESSQETIKTALKKAQQNISTIDELYKEIIQTEKILVEECRFADWREIDQFDIQESIWNGCIKMTLQDRVFEIINQRTNRLLDYLIKTMNSSQKDIKTCDSTIVGSFWNEQKLKNNKILEFCYNFQNKLDDEFEALTNELLILEKDFRFILVKICERITEFLINIQQNIQKFKNINEFSFFGALFYRDLNKKCPSLMKLYSFSDKTIQEQFHKQIGDICCEFYYDWFEYRMEILLDNFDKSSYCELEKFLSNLTVWDKISIQAENSQQSIIEIPLQLSLSTYDLLMNLSKEINQYCVHTLPKRVLIRIFSMLGKRFIEITKESLNSIKNSSLPGSVKQTMSVQLYFDLLFLKSLFLSSKNDSLRKDVITSINDQLVNIESLIDPFDLHLMVPYMKNNAENLHRTCGLLFAFLRADKVDNRFKISSKQDNTNALNDKIITNTMWLHSCDNDLLS